MDDWNSHKEALKRHLLASPCKGTVLTEAVPSVAPSTPSRFQCFPSKPTTAPLPLPQLGGKLEQSYSERQHTRGVSEVFARSAKESAEENEETIRIKARVAGAFGTHRTFLRVCRNQQMNKEKRGLEKSLEEAKRDWEKLSESLGIGRAVYTPEPSISIKPSISTNAWRAKTPTEAPTRPINFILSYKRVLSSAQSTRKRRVLDVGWRAKISGSPTKREQSEQSVLDPASVSASQYINWFRKRTRSLSRGTNLQAEERPVCNKARKAYERMIAKSSLTPILTTARRTEDNKSGETQTN